MNIWMDEDSGLAEEAKAVFSQAAEHCLQAEGIEESDRFALNLTVVDEEEIRQLNRDFRGIDRVTDVLSFPQFERAEEIRQAAKFGALAGEKAALEGEKIPLGDVVICREQVRRQAAEYGHSQRCEMVYLFVHSVLHLLGHDHMEEEDRKRMRVREEEIMSALGIRREEEPIDYRELYRIAEDAAQNAYAPYSHFRVGAALLTASGSVYTGVNVENASYGATICAERTALVKAISEGEREFLAIAVHGGDSPAVPCGICRQFMAEFAPRIHVITGPLKESEEGGGLCVRPLFRLLPEAFVLPTE